MGATLLQATLPPGAMPSEEELELELEIFFTDALMARHMEKLEGSSYTI